MNTARNRKAGLLFLPTFLVDPPTMLIAGIAFAWLGGKVLKPRLAEGSWLRKNVIFLLCALFQLSFWILGPLMYWEHPYFAAQGLDNDFMWNGYIRALGWSPIPTDPPTYHSLGWNIAAFIGWAVQPFFLWLGVQAGYSLFGRNRHQNGVLGLMKGQ